MGLPDEIVDVLLEAEITPAELIRQSSIGVDMSDFYIDQRQDRFGNWPTGNTLFSISYKPIQVKGRPLYLGSVLGTHDYNNTGRTDLTNYYIQSVPSWQREYTGYQKGRTGKPLFKHPQYRKYYGHRGIVSMDKPEETSFTNLFDAAKYLLSLVRINSRANPKFDLPAA